MKKILLLLCIAGSCLCARSQNFSLSSATVTTGGTVTLTADRETDLDHWTAISTVTTAQFNSNVTITISNVTLYQSPSSPTVITLTVKNSGTQAATVGLVINGSTNTGSGGPAIGDGDQSLQINPTPPSVFHSSAESGPFIDQSCGSGSLGTTVTYNVPAGKYTSTVSQGAADQLAKNDVAANGPGFANANGQCIPVFAKLVGVFRAGDGSHVIASFYSDAGCTVRLPLPSTLNITVTWFEYVNTTDNTTTGVSMVYTVPQGSSTLDIGHREFWLTNPVLSGAIKTSDQVASVALQPGANYTLEANTGSFMHDN
jgi:hypothetical protein